MTITKAALDQELAALAANRGFLSRVQAGSAVTGSGPHGFSGAFVASVLTQEIDTGAAEALLVRRHAAPLDASLAASVTTATFAQTYGGLSFSSFPASYRAVLVQRTAADIGLEASLQKIDIGESALAAYRSAHLAQFGTYCVSAVLRGTRHEAAMSEARIRAGAAIATVARTSSQDPSSAHGGQLGCGTSGMFDTAFTPALVTAPLNQPTTPIHDPQGWYTLVVTSRNVRSITTAAPDIVNALLPDDEAAETAIASYLAMTPVTVNASYGTFNPHAEPPAVVARK